VADPVLDDDDSTQLDELLMPLRFFGDQILRRVATEVADIDGDIVELGRRMLVTMDHEAGIGLAGPQVGRAQRLFVHGLADEAPPVLINPVIVESRGEWVYQEGCLSIPGLYFDVVRPKEIHVKAWGVDGEELDFDADELLARVIQHETDHLDGVLFVDRISGEDRQAAEAELRKRVAGTLGTSDPFLTGRAIKALLRKRG
jgi:peptide deformylase